MRRLLLVLSVGFWCATAWAAIGAEFQATPPAKHPEEITGIPQQTIKPLLVCPPRFSTPRFVPADELLRQADLLNPVTPEGWIITNRPVPNCDHCVGDPAARAFQNFEYPLKLRQYDSQIRMLQAEIASWQRKLRNYQYFNKGGALPVTVENTRLTLMATQEQLRLLRYERLLYIKHHQQEAQLRTGTNYGM